MSGAETMVCVLYSGRGSVHQSSHQLEHGNVANSGRKIVYSYIYIYQSSSSVEPIAISYCRMESVSPSVTRLDLPGNSYHYTTNTTTWPALSGNSTCMGSTKLSLWIQAD